MNFVVTKQKKQKEKKILEKLILGGGWKELIKKEKNLKKK